MCSDGNHRSDRPNPEPGSLALLTNKCDHPLVVEVVPDHLLLVVVPSVGTTLRFDPIGEVCTLTASRFRQYVSALIPPGEWHVELDLSGVDFMDGRGVAVLAALAVDPRVSRLSLLSVSLFLTGVLRLCALDHLIADSASP